MTQLYLSPTLASFLCHDWGSLTLSRIQAGFGETDRHKREQQNQYNISIRLFRIDFAYVIEL